MTSTAAPPLPAYRNRDLPAEQRVADLLARMTLEEKAAQMVVRLAAEGRDACGRGRPLRPRQGAGAAFGHGHGLGQVGRPSDAGPGTERAPEGGAHQRDPALLPRAEPRLAFRSSSTRSACTATRRRDATSFCAADRAGRHVQSRARRVAVRDDGAGGAGARHAPGADAGGGRGARSALGPRRGDLRRGSVPRLRAWASPRCAASRATRTFRDSTRVIATLKHFAAHGQPESGSNCAPANISERVLRDTFLATFRQAIQRGRRHQRHGVVQRDRRRPVARQPLAAARRAAERVGLHGLRRLGLLRHLGAERPAGHARPPRGRTTRRRPARWPCGPA